MRPSTIRDAFRQLRGVRYEDHEKRIMKEEHGKRSTVRGVRGVGWGAERSPGASLHHCMYISVRRPRTRSTGVTSSLGTLHTTIRVSSLPARDNTAVTSSSSSSSSSL